MAKPDIVFHQGESRTTEVGEHHEALPDKIYTRVVLFGSTMSGVQDLEKVLQAYLEQKGIKYPKVESYANAGYMRQAILDIGEGQVNTPPHPNLPVGVVLLPEMRQHDPWNHSGMSIPSYGYGISDTVEKLCVQFKIPLIEIRDDASAAEIMAKVRKLL